MQIRIGGAAWVGVFSFCPALTAWVVAAPLYMLTDLGDLAGGGNFSLAYGVNNYGQVTGISTAATGSRAFLWTPTTLNGTVGSMVNLGELPGGLDHSLGRGINDYGQVVGYSISTFGDRAFLWSPSVRNGTTGSMVGLGDLPGGDDASSGYAVNAYGQVTGDSYATSGRRAFLWTPDRPNADTGAMSNLGDLPGGADLSVGYAVNGIGQVSGTSSAGTGDRAFLWTPATPHGSSGSIVDLGDLAGGADYSLGYAINNVGQVVGSSIAATSIGYRAFLWTPTDANGPAGAMVDLGVLPGGSDDSRGYSLNALGQVVGSTNLANGGRAFLWTAEDGMIDLNILLVGGGDAWRIQTATGINNGGQIVGFGMYDPDGTGGVAAVQHAFLLTPVPDPAISALVSVTAALLVRRRTAR